MRPAIFTCSIACRASGDASSPSVDDRKRGGGVRIVEITVNCDENKPESTPSASIRYCVWAGSALATTSAGVVSFACHAAKVTMFA